MRKHLLPVFILLIASSVDSQDVVSRITKNYFRSDPFGKEFSAFMVHLIKDPAIEKSTMEKRTDSTLFFFDGTYKDGTFNPFFFKPKRIEVVLTEVSVDLDSTTKDTIFIYELLAYNNATKEGNAEIKKEFDKIFKHYKGNFFRNEYMDTKGRKLKGDTYNFFDRYHAVAPFALSLYGPDGNNEMCLILTVRLDSFNNMAVLALPFVPYRIPQQDEEEMDDQ